MSNRSKRRASNQALKGMPKRKTLRREEAVQLILPKEEVNSNQLRDAIRLQKITVSQARMERRDNHAYRHAMPCKKKIKMSITRN